MTDDFQLHEDLAVRWLVFCREFPELKDLPGLQGVFSYAWTNGWKENQAAPACYNG